MIEEEIKLSAIEATAYWWINMIKAKVREIAIQGTNDKSEANFVNIFYYNTEVEWRKLYLELTKYITEDVDNYVSIDKYDDDIFSQDTAKKGHDRINRALSKITNQHIPDIRLSSNSAKDFVIYTNNFYASVWYKSCGTTNLPDKYEPTYILTGDNKKLNFYNLFISTIMVLKNTNMDFKSIPLLKKSFCKEYKKNNTEDSIEDINKMINDSFQKACDKGIISRLYDGTTYFCFFRNIDLIGLDQYMDTAEHYANVVLQNAKDNNGYSYSKKRQNKNNK